MYLALALALLIWPQFRGPDGTGVSPAKNLPADFGPSKNVVWRVELPPGHSSPVIWKDRIYLTAAEGGARKDAPGQKVVDDGGKLWTICLDRASGKILWKREAPRPRIEPYQPTNSPASPSPVADADGVYVFFGDFGLLAYTHSGEPRWQVPLGPFNNANGHGSSPIVSGGSVIQLCDQDAGGFIIAVDARTGKTRWRTERPEVTRSYSTPVVYRGREVIVPGSHQLTSYDLRTGKKLWWITGLSWQPKSTPVIHNDTIYAHWWESGGEAETPASTPPFDEVLAQFDKNKDRKLAQEELETDTRMARLIVNNDLDLDGKIDQRDWDFYRSKRASLNALLAVKPQATGDLTGSKSIVWRMQKFLPNVPSPLIYEGWIYLIKDGGVLSAVDAVTGRIGKQGRLEGALDTYYASPVAGAGLVYVLSQTGKLSIVRAGEQWERLAMIDFEEPCFATPAIADETLYLRTRSTLYAFRQ